MTASKRPRRSYFCQTCGADCGPGEQRMAKYDAAWCPRCDEWLSEGCGGAACEFCAERPERPSMVPVEHRKTWAGA